MAAPRSDAATIAARQSRLVELLSEGKSQTEAAEILRSEGHPASDPTVRRDVGRLGRQWTATIVQDFAASAEEEYRWLQELKMDLSDPKIKADRRIELALAILDREMKLLGTAAPTKSIQAHVSSAQLDPLYLDVRGVLQDLEEDDQEAGLELLREFARSRVKPLILDAAVPQLSDGCEFEPDEVDLEPSDGDSQQGDQEPKPKYLSARAVIAAIKGEDNG